jgi:hypothetical protein
MNAPLYVMPPLPVPVPEQAPPVREMVELLRQMIGLQQEHVNLIKTQIANQDNSNRWKSFLARWEQEFPNIGSSCKQALPMLERTYLHLVREMTERVNSTDMPELDDEFVLSEFLDRFGIRLGQLGNILSQIAPLAEAAPAEPGPAT